MHAPSSPRHDVFRAVVGRQKEKPNKDREPYFPAVQITFTSRVTGSFP